ncbi:MAG: response regulator [Ignavibacteriaceae bacterium]
MIDNEIEILLVEDNPYDAEMTIRALKQNNISNKIFHVKDGSEAIDFLFAKGNYQERNMTTIPKVILLDLKLPKISGLEVLQILKSDELTKNIPVVVLTSSQEELDIKGSYKLGANSYIVKPVEFENFIKAVSDIGLYWLLLNKSPD